MTESGISMIHIYNGPGIFMIYFYNGPIIDMPGPI
jgi:hypothetical protein